MQQENSCCLNCKRKDRPFHWYMWNTRTMKGKIAQSYAGLLCERCAKSLGAWQVAKQPYNQQLTAEEAKQFDEINSIIEQRTN